MDKKEMINRLNIKVEGDFIEGQVESILYLLQREFEDDKEAKLNHYLNGSTISEKEDEIVEGDIKDWLWEVWGEEFYTFNWFGDLIMNEISWDSAYSIARDITKEVLKILIE